MIFSGPFPILFEHVYRPSFDRTETICEHENVHQGHTSDDSFISFPTAKILLTRDLSVAKIAAHSKGRILFKDHVIFHPIHQCQCLFDEMAEALLRVSYSFFFLFFRST